MPKTGKSKKMDRIKNLFLILCSLLLVASLAALWSCTGKIEAALNNADGDIVHALADLSGNTELLLSQEEFNMDLVYGLLGKANLAIQALNTRQALSATVDAYHLKDLCVAYRILYSRLSDTGSADSSKLSRIKPLLESLQQYLKPLAESCVGQQPSQQFPQAVKAFNQAVENEEPQEFQTLLMDVNLL